MTPITHQIAHTQPASTTELLSILALFPKCTTCGAHMSALEPIEPDPTHAFRLRHAGPCTPPLAA